MKSSNFLRKYAAIAAVYTVSAAFSLVACAKEPSLVEEPTITMTTMASEVSLYVSGARDIAIDWGDGRRSSGVSDASFDEISGNFRFSQDYSDETSRNIVITGSVERLEVYYCQLTALDVSRSPGLLELHLGGNQLTVLDVSQNIALTRLDCANNRLTALDVSRNPALKFLDCSANLLTEIDVSSNTALEVLAIGYNQLTYIDVSSNTALVSLGFNHNQVKSLDISKNTALIGLHVARNQFTASALNEIFRALPDLTGFELIGTITIATNFSYNDPAVVECDRSITERKRWSFRTFR